ncbi:uncharacterized protein F5891DRAFT_982747 [Suillus fuscotomentosus]|uniref:Uncharacterized protein n=1 Tax=Suillus fuscotomentosus TaxID=1912939 RepID=A0AAD4E2N4_9AGAM|nr:uncharacterized protein F5891DRAFT_982747 [Suillus fuscotomentosus]KAG1897364.1 hypothetical protein F5891DRAFT_982747 [Suillus fuscotomentosus]
MLVQRHIVVVVKSHECQCLGASLQPALERQHKGRDLANILVLLVIQTALGLKDPTSLRCQCDKHFPFPPGSLSSNLNEADSHGNFSTNLDARSTLTAKVVKELAHATAQGSFGDVWKCMFSNKDINAETHRFGLTVYCNKVAHADLTGYLITRWLWPSPRGVKPERLDIPIVDNCHGDFMEQFWVESSQRPHC